MRQSASVCLGLPFVPRPFPDEMLSSWLWRIAVEYGISLGHLAKHLRLSTSKPAEMDHAPTRDDIERIAAALHVTATDIRKMVHRTLKTPVRTLLASRSPIQVCSQCRAHHVRQTEQPVAIKAWFEYWRIECRQCGLPFSPPGGPNLQQSDPLREEPEWFEQILPYARQGAGQLATFVRRPYGALISPIAILQLLSMRLGASASVAPELKCGWPDEGPGDHHCVAEFLLPGLRERLSEYPLLPALWTEKSPVRLVTARTILFAAMANFQIDPRAAYTRIIASLSWPKRFAVERWLLTLPDYSARVLAPVSRVASNTANPVSHLQQM